MSGKPCVPTIFMVISSGFQARSWLRSGVLDYLKEDGHRIVLLSPNANEPYFRAEFADDNVHIRLLNTGSKRVDYYMQRIRNYLFETMLPVETNAIRRERMRRHDSVRYWITQGLNGRWAHRLFQVWRWFDRLLVMDHYNTRVFEEFDPDILVVATLGRTLEDVLALRRAKKKSVRTLAVQRKWDNFTTKEYVREPVDKLIVWNEYNQQEAISLLGFSSEDVYVAGVPDFDIYHKAPYQSRETCFREYRLDPKRRLLLLTGQDGQVCPDMGDIVRILAQAIEAEQFVYPCQLMVRPHPHVYSGVNPGPGTEEDLCRYEKLSPHVHGNRPQIASQQLKSDMSRGELESLADVLYYADIVLDFFGTVTLEAFAVGTPVVHIGFDGFKQKDYHDSVLRFSGFTHNRRVVESGGVLLALSAEELIAHVNAYLQNPNLNAKHRREAAEQNCYRLDGLSARRVARRISAYARGEWVG